MCFYSNSSPNIAQMAENLDFRTVVKHLVNGTLAGNLCVVCLLPFTEDNFENIFTSIGQQDMEYCTADVLREVCKLKIQDTDHYNICSNCFQASTTTYQFYQQAKRSHDILNFYVDQLLNKTKGLELNEGESKRMPYIPLPIYTPETSGFEDRFDSTRKIGDDSEAANGNDVEVNTATDTTDSNNSVADKEEEVILIVEDGKSTYHLKDADKSDSEVTDDENILMIVNEKIRKKRDPMTYTSCTHCPVRYRFLSKLKDHVKRTHNVDIYYCKICKLITENKANYEEHILTHAGEYQCTQCNAVYRRHESLLAHMKSHENYKKCQQENVANGNICEICGVVLPDEAALAEHRATRHVLRYTCYYCGRMYKGRNSFEAHIKKHEAHLNNKSKPQRKPSSEAKVEKPKVPEASEESSSKRSICGVCGKSFVDERSLLWHQRLHDNDRPFVCDVCSRGFVSVNRRNQHALCAHSPPARRCPLCPALFHLRSMVNTHLKKVHLSKQQKRRNRVAKHTNVFWRTETVPIQELSVSIQNEVLEMQSSQDKQLKYLNKINSKKDTKHKKPNPIQYKQHSFNLSDIKVIDLPNDIMMSQEQDFELSVSSDMFMN